MSAAISNTTFFSSGAISFSALRSAFKEVSDGAISASELFRDTDTTNISPTVPDCTENQNVATTSDLRLSSFRNTIKRYDVIQTGTDQVTALDPGLGNVRTSINWNGNGRRNIIKRFIVQGTMGSTLTGTPALYFEGQGFNYRIVVQGNIRAAGGGGGVAGSPTGKDGGNAIEVRNTNPDAVRPNPAGFHRVILNDGCTVWAGGGGGSRGQTGPDGTRGTCTSTSTYITGRNCDGCPSCDPGDERLRCFQDGGCNCGKGGCRAAWIRAECRKTIRYEVPGAAGGAGGNGGNGQGYLQARQNGFAGDPGSPGGCPTLGGDGGTGETGGNGGDWAQAGNTTTRPVTAGQPGRAVVGEFYTVEGVINTNTIRGAYT